MSAAWVFDSSALLAWLQDERGGERVTAALAEGADISAVNWAETLSKLTDGGKSTEDAVEELTERSLFQCLAILPLTEEIAVDVARLRPLARKAGLSLGDRACLALARSLKLPVLTADRTWTRLHVGVKIESIR